MWIVFKLFFLICYWGYTSFFLSLVLQSWLYIWLDGWLPDNVCDIFKSYNFPTKHIVYLIIQFSDSACYISAEYKGSILYQLMVVSIETKKKNNVNTIQILFYKHINLLEVWIVFKLFFFLTIAATHHFPVSSFAKLAVYLVDWVASFSFKFSYFVTMSVTYPRDLQDC